MRPPTEKGKELVGEMTTAVVTGAARGIGRAVGQELADRGHDVVAVDVLESVRETETDRIRAVVCDLTDPDAPERVLDGVEPRILVNCAFASEHASLLGGTDAGWALTFDVSLHAAVRLAKAFAAPLIACGQPGAIVNIASVHARFAAQGFGAYSAAKAGLVAFTRSAAHEWGPHGIRVNAVAPGLVIVERNADLAEPEIYAQVTRQYPLRRAGRPAEVAKAVAFLAGDDASLITGAVLPVDGGLSARIAEAHL